METKELQSVLEEIFLKTIDVCNVLELNYFIIGGTALGAVRHKGFIPWDDDLDIGMCREDYNRFLMYGQEHLGEDYFLQVLNTEPNSPFYFSKVRKNGTKFVERYCRDIDMNHGIYIDVFPYDNIPDNFLRRKIFYFKAKVINNLFVSKTLKELNGNHKGIKKCMLLMIRRICSIISMFIKKESLWRIQDKTFQKYNNKNYKHLGYPFLPHLTIPRKNLEKLEEIEFEGHKVSCPGEIEKYLEYAYGDYMKLPPEHLRESHNAIEIDFGERQK